MIWVEATRDRSDDPDSDIGNYTIKVRATKTENEIQLIAAARVENYDRKQGWRPLMKKALEALDKESDQESLYRHYKVNLVDFIEDFVVKGKMK